jgi:hypothetical protein
MGIHAVYARLMRGFRRRRMRAFERRFQPGPETRILDVGGTPFNWQFVRARSRVTLLNLEPPAGAEALPANFTLLRGSGVALAFPDAAFDVAFSNSVIEHLGSWESQQAFARELRRVGRGVWVQTPARSFPFEPHLLTPFVHYLPRRWQARLLRNFTVWGWIARPSPQSVSRFLSETRLLGGAEMRALFPDCEIRRERFLGLTKAWVAVRQAQSAGPGPEAAGCAEPGPPPHRRRAPGTARA